MWNRAFGCVPEERPPRQAGGRAALEGKIARALSLLDDFPLTSLRTPSRLTGLPFRCCAGVFVRELQFRAPYRIRPSTGHDPAHGHRADSAQVAILYIPA